MRTQARLFASLLSVLALLGCTHVRAVRRPADAGALQRQAAQDPAAAFESHRVAETVPGYGRVGGDWYGLRDLKQAAAEIGADGARRDYNGAQVKKLLRDLLPPVSVAAGTALGLVAVVLSGFSDGPPIANDEQRTVMFASGVGLGLVAAAIEWPLLNRALGRATARGADRYNKALAQTLKLSAAPLPGGAGAGLALNF